jgi:hypothetical protein
MTLLVIAAALLLAVAMPASVTASATELIHGYGFSGSDTGYALNKHSIDNGMLICGKSDVGLGGSQRMLLIKTDSLGIEQWAKSYGDSVLMKCVIEHSIDNGIAAAGEASVWGILL